VIGFEAEGSAGVVADQGGFDAGSVRGEEKFCEVCMEIKRGGASLLQLFANRGAYVAAGEWGALREAGAEVGDLIEERRDVALEGGEEGFCFEGEIVSVEQALGIGVERFYLFNANRPAQGGKLG